MGLSILHGMMQLAARMLETNQHTALMKQCTMFNVVVSAAMGPWDNMLNRSVWLALLRTSG